MGRKKGADREVWWVNKKGYIEGRVYRDGVCRLVKQQRWIVEQRLGRRLSPTEIVHHINGDRQDNRIENLEIRTNGQHTSYHNKRRIYHNTKYTITDEERQRRSDFMKEVHRRRQENDPTNQWYGQRKIGQL